MKCRPSGRNCGNRWPAVPCPVSSRVTATGSPPAAGTFRRGPFVRGANRMVPSRLQAPPLAVPAVPVLASTCSAPPAMSMRFSLLSAKIRPTRCQATRMDSLLPPFPPAAVRHPNPMAGPRVEICLHSMPRTPAAVRPAKWQMKPDRPLKAYSPQREFQVAQAANVTYGSYFNLPEDTGRAREEFKTKTTPVHRQRENRFC